MLLGGNIPIPLSLNTCFVAVCRPTDNYLLLNCECIIFYYCEFSKVKSVALSGCKGKRARGCPSSTWPSLTLRETCYTLYMCKKDDPMPNKWFCNRLSLLLSHLSVWCNSLRISIIDLVKTLLFSKPTEPVTSVTWQNERKLPLIRLDDRLNRHVYYANRILTQQVIPYIRNKRRLNLQQDNRITIEWVI